MYIGVDMPSTVYSDVLPKVVHTMMTQLAVKKGLKEFGDQGKDAVSSELPQIHMQDTFAPTYGGDLTSEERRQALESLLFLEEKRSGKIKGRMCANGSTQRSRYEKGEDTSPTVSGDAVLITSAIDVHEGRDMAVIDLPGTFLHAEMGDVVYMVMRG